MKKILVVSKTIEQNGIGALIYAFYKFADKSRFQFVFLHSGLIIDQYRQEFEKDGCKIYEIKGRDYRYFHYVKELRKIIKREQIDVVHVHGNSATITIELLAAYLAGAKVRIAHSHNTTCTHKIANFILQPFFKKAYTKGLACGALAGEWMFKDREFTLIKNGVELDKFSFNISDRIAIRNEQGWESSLVIGHVGRFTEQKNHKLLIDIFKQVTVKQPNAKLVLVGEGPLEEDLKKQVKRLELEESVIFWGTTTNPQRLYNAFDCFVLPSLFEGVPLVLMEACANGLKCLMSDAVSDEVMLVDSIQKIGLDDGIEKWVESIPEIDDETKRGRTSFANIATLREAGFDIKDSVRKLEAVYEGQI